ncbi:hypothetical protein CAPTEDRAFT_227125 [Capitella teleta]|uniref:Uncharacterized protein n=1 Tax=Capitella teleta TaxID=283909 RepID=R7VAM1_CAPTE|nr:hypothetical protein CAPTEDRAFT_227125 [Capitella teleta]|eukprot:ELU12735.1 hypothetical protein CAPTEDRAFT_227125 [Capitella teleta]
MDNQSQSEDDEVFFGPISDKELKKSRKFSRRKTALFVPGFREDRKQMRLTMLANQMGVLAEEHVDQKENFPPAHVITGESAGKTRMQRAPFAPHQKIDYANEEADYANEEQAAGIDTATAVNDGAQQFALSSQPADLRSDRTNSANSACWALTEYHSRKDILRGFFRDTMASDVAIRQFDFSADHGKESTNEESIIDLKEDVTMVIKRHSNEGTSHDESINSSLSSNGPKPEMLAEACVVPADVENPKAAKAVYDMSPLVQTLPALKVTTPIRLHDEQNSAFKMYGSQGELRIAKDIGDNICGGDSGIEDGGSESPSKISRASSCATTISPEVTETPPVVKKKTPKSTRKVDNGQLKKTPRHRSEDRTNSYIHSEERKQSRPPLTPSNTPRSPRVTRSSRATQKSHKVDPKEVTERLHSPAASRCCRHNHGSVAADGRPVWNPSTLLDETTLRGSYLNSKETAIFASPFSFLKHTPGSTPRSSRKRTPRKEPAPKLDLDRLDSVPRKGQAKVTAATPDEKQNPSQKRVRSPGSAAHSANKRLPPFQSDGVSSPKDHRLLSLNEHQLDAVTNLHTMCNGQQQAKFVTKALATKIIKKAPEPKSPKIQWPSNPAIELDCPSPAGQKAAKPILHIRKPDELFPYVGEPPSPVVVKKTSTRRNVNPLSSFSF